MVSEKTRLKSKIRRFFGGYIILSKKRVKSKLDLLEFYRPALEYFKVTDIKQLASKLGLHPTTLRYRYLSWLKLGFPLEFLAVTHVFLRPVKDSSGSWHYNLENACDNLGVSIYKVKGAKDNAGVIQLSEL